MQTLIIIIIIIVMGTYLRMSRESNVIKAR